MVRRRLTAEALWAFERLRERLRRDLRLARQELPSDTPDLYDRVDVLRDEAVPMRDGVRLYCDVYLPAGERCGGAAATPPPSAALPAPGAATSAPSSARFPVVLIRLPYGKREAYCYMPAHGRFWARKGYACVVQDVRGKWASEGDFEPYENEARDGWDTVDWIAAQPWCDGNIGMTGESYYGSTQWAVASSGHPNLKCLAPGDVDPERYSAVHDGGALCFATAGVYSFEVCARRQLNHHRFDTWHLPLATADAAAGRQTGMYQRLIRHPSRDDEWDRLDADVRYEEIAIPMMHWGGWWDVHTHGTIAGWRRVRERSASPEARAAQFLVLGGTDHELSTEFTGRAGRVAIRGHGYAHDRVRRFMDGVLKAGEAAPGRAGTLGDALRATPRVQYFVVGRDEWRGADEWPPPDVETVPYYLGGDGAAAAGSTGAGELAAAPPAAESVDTYSYDPANPVRFWVGHSVWAVAEELDDRREVEARPDVLVYSGEPLDHELEVTGPVRVRLFASSSAPDTDFTAALVDVFPDGYAQLVWEGIVRARYRESERRPSSIEPGTVYEYLIDLASVSYAFPPGHSLRLEISSSNFDRYDRNQNTGEACGTSARLQIAHQAVYHDRERPSALMLPVRPVA